jgi:hypothetical protein
MKQTVSFIYSQNNKNTSKRSLIRLFLPCTPQNSATNTTSPAQNPENLKEKPNSDGQTARKTACNSPSKHIQVISARKMS